MGMRSRLPSPEGRQFTLSSQLSNASVCTELEQSVSENFTHPVFFPPFIILFMFVCINSLCEILSSFLVLLLFSDILAGCRDWNRMVGLLLQLSNI